VARRKQTQSDDSDTLLDLSPRQLVAVDLVALGQADQDVADRVGVTRQTVNVWRNHHPGFAVAVEERRRAAWDASVDGLRALMPKAVEVIGASLDGSDGWRVALALVKLSGAAENQGLRPSGPEDAGEFLDNKARRIKVRTLYGFEGELYRDAARERAQVLVTAAERDADKCSSSTTPEGSDVLP